MSCMAPSSANEINQHSWHLLVLTYNVFRQLAPIDCDQIDDSLFASIDQIDTLDMIVVGLQEVSHTELVKSTLSEFRRWNRILIDGICKRNRQLVCIGEYWLADNSLFVLIDRRLLVHIASVDPMYVRTSFYGLTGHKGTVAVRIVLNNAPSSSFLFICSHFAADFPNVESFYSRRVTEFRLTNDYLMKSGASDCTIWLGDLNSRVDRLTYSELMEILPTDDSDEQMEHLVKKCDQLRLAQQAGDAFFDYHEAPIRFGPTYKYIVGTNILNRHRTPSWCDRILYRSRLSIKCERYWSIPTMQMSDHIPVAARFTLKVPINNNTDNDWPMQFDIVHDLTWITTVSFVCRFRFMDNVDYWQNDGSYFDWIGVYRDNFDDVQNPITWLYMSRCFNEPIGGVPWYMADFGVMLAGHYRIGYYSRNRRCMLGLSEQFEVVGVAEEAK